MKKKTGEKGNLHSPTDGEVSDLFTAVMKNCKLERNSRNIAPKDLVKKLQVTGNHLSAVENGRGNPSAKTLLRYLLTLGFDLQCLRNLKIKDAKTGLTELATLRQKLSNKIFTLDEDQLLFLLELAKVAEVLQVKVKRIEAEVKK